MRKLRRQVKQLQFQQLRVAIRNAGYCIYDFAEAMGESSPWLSNRLTGRTPWQVSEALQVLALLQLPPEDFCIYFKDCATR